MPTCRYCGDDIEFRYVDGQPTPIHVNGGWCHGDRSPSSAKEPQPFASRQSYVNPNAHCPVCNEQVYFYQSPHGGRVYFDDLGWPWPKHGCTDNPRAQTANVKRLKLNRHKGFVSKSGETLTVYERAELDERYGTYYLKLRLVGQRVVFTVAISRELLEEADVTIQDIREAPSFVVRTYDDWRIIEFISARKRSIGSLKISRLKA